MFTLKVFWKYSTSIETIGTQKVSKSGTVIEVP